MNNQVAALRAMNISVATINSSVHLADRDDIFKDMKCGILLHLYSSIVIDTGFSKDILTQD